MNHKFHSRAYTLYAIPFQKPKYKCQTSSQLLGELGSRTLFHSFVPASFQRQNKRHELMSAVLQYIRMTFTTLFITLIHTGEMFSGTRLQSSCSSKSFPMTNKAILCSFSFGITYHSPHYSTALSHLREIFSRFSLLLSLLSLFWRFSLPIIFDFTSFSQVFMLLSFAQTLCSRNSHQQTYRQPLQSFEPMNCEPRSSSLSVACKQLSLRLARTASISAAPKLTRFCWSSLLLFLTKVISCFFYKCCRPFPSHWCHRAHIIQASSTTDVVAQRSLAKRRRLTTIRALWFR